MNVILKKMSIFFWGSLFIAMIYGCRTQDANSPESNSQNIVGLNELYIDIAGLSNAEAVNKLFKSDMDLDLKMIHYAENYVANDWEGLEYTAKETIFYRGSESKMVISGQYGGTVTLNGIPEEVEMRKTEDNWLWYSFSVNGVTAIKEGNVKVNISHGFPLEGNDLDINHMFQIDMVFLEEDTGDALRFWGNSKTN